MEFFGFGIYELFLLFFVYVLGCIVISDQLRLRWWSSKGCNSNKNSQEANGPTNWVFWIAIVYITQKNKKNKKSPKSENSKNPKFQKPKNPKKQK